MSWLITILREVPDPRTGNATRHDLLEVLTIALTASIRGCESCVEFADFAEDREQLFREFLHLENGLPSHDTFSRLLRLIDRQALSACLGRFLDALGADGGGVVAIDGKTLRRSFDRAAGASPLHVVTAFAAEAQLVIGQKAVAAGRQRNHRGAGASGDARPERRAGHRRRDPLQRRHGADGARARRR